MTARLIRDGYIPGYANAARSRAAALTEAKALVDEKTNAPAAPRDEAPFRRQE
jgi:hypothetical protein